MGSTPKKLVVVFTATGDQGRSIVSQLASDGKYAVRALTRNPSSPAAQKLASQGAEVVECSLDSDTDVRNAVKGAWAIFANSDFFSTFTVEAEAAQGRRIIDAASKEPGLEIFIQSCFPPLADYTKGTCPGLLHYAAKNEINRINREEYPAVWAKTTQVFVGYYDSNWIKFAVPFGPKKVAGSDGGAELVQSIPYPGTTPIASFDTEDLGLIIAAILDKPQAFHTKIVAATGEWISDNDKLASIGKGTSSPNPKTYPARRTQTNECRLQPLTSKPASPKSPPKPTSPSSNPRRPSPRTSCKTCRTK